MSILKKISDIVRSNINELVSKAEDPVKMINQFIIDLDENYKNAKVSVAKVMGEAAVLQKRLYEQKEEVEKWKQSAMIAVQKGDDELAKEALKRKKNAEELVMELSKQAEEQFMLVEDLKRALKALELKIEQAKMRRYLLMMKARRVQAQKELKEAFTALPGQQAFADFDRMEEKIDFLEAQTMAMLELEKSSLEDRIKQLKDADEIDNELKALKQQMGLLLEEGEIIDQDRDNDKNKD